MTFAQSKQVSLLQISPFPQLTDSDSEAISTSASLVASMHFTVPPTLSGSNVATVEKLCAMITELSERSSLLLIRLSADPAIPRAWPLADMILSDALWLLHEEFPDALRIAIYSDQLAVPTDDLARLAEEEPFDRILTLSGTYQEALRNLGVSSPRRASAGARARRNAAALQRGSLRYRGAFRSRTGRTHYRYHYSVLPSAHDELVATITNYFSEEAVEVILFDQGAGGDWFTSCLLRAAQEAGVPALDARSLEDSYEQPGDDELHAQNVARRLMAEGGRTCLAVPVCKTGGAIIDKYVGVVGGDSENARIFSVYFDEGQSRGRAKAVSGVFRKTAAVQGRDVDFVLNVPVALLSESSWEASAAELLGESVVQEGNREISSVGVMSLLRECGSGVESPVPAGRRPISVFPLLGAISDWDAQWLAEHLVLKVEDVLDIARSRLLFVVPEEDIQNGSEPLRKALEARLDTSVARLRRATIQGAEPPLEEAKMLTQAFEAWKAVALADESTVSFGTLKGMRQVLKDRLGADVAVAATILNLSADDASLGIPLVALAAWSPQRFERVLE